MFSSMFKGFTEGIVYSTVITIVMVAFFTYAPDFEFNHMPVITQFKAILISQEDAYRNYNVTFFKKRSCEIDLSSVSWYYTNINNELEKVQIVLPARQGDPTRPAGLNASNDWKVYIPKGTVVRNQKFVVYHYCHPGWRSRTEVMIESK